MEEMKQVFFIFLCSHQDYLYISHTALKSLKALLKTIHVLRTKKLSFFCFYFIINDNVSSYKSLLQCYTQAEVVQYQIGDKGWLGKMLPIKESKYTSPIHFYEPVKFFSPVQHVGLFILYNNQLFHLCSRIKLMFALLLHNLEKNGNICSDFSLYVYIFLV